MRLYCCGKAVTGIGNVPKWEPVRRNNDKVLTDSGDEIKILYGHHQLFRSNSFKPRRLRTTPEMEKARSKRFTHSDSSRYLNNLVTFDHTGHIWSSGHNIH